MNNNGKSLENWIWDAACSIRGAKDAAIPWSDPGLPFWASFEYTRCIAENSRLMHLQ